MAFSSQTCHPSLLESSLCGPQCPLINKCQACPLTLLLPCFGSHKTKLLTTSFLLLQQWPLNLRRLSLIVVEILGNPARSTSFVMCFCQVTFFTTLSIFVYAPLSRDCAYVQTVDPYTRSISTVALKYPIFRPSESPDFHIILSLWSAGYNDYKILNHSICIE